jgi:hypothetical protein
MPSERDAWERKEKRAEKMFLSGLSLFAIPVGLGFLLAVSACVASMCGVDVR